MAAPTFHFGNTCHCEPARTLVWQSVLFENVRTINILENADCHTSDIGHWFAMTAFFPFYALLTQFRHVQHLAIDGQLL